MVMSKKGQELTLGTIILIVLGIAVLVFLIFGFSTGWSNLWQKVTGLGGGTMNVETIKIDCQSDCQNGVTYGFCTEQREVVIENNFKNSTVTCKMLTGEVNFTKGSKGKMANVGISPCSSLC